MKPNLKNINEIVKKLIPFAWDASIYINPNGEVRFHPEYDDDWKVLAPLGLKQTHESYESLILSYVPEGKFS